MARRRWTFREAMEYGRSMQLYDRHGRRLLRRSEWEQLPRWRRWRDILLGWVPPREWRFPWEEEDAREG